MDEIVLFLGSLFLFLFFDTLIWKCFFLGVGSLGVYLVRNSRKSRQAFHSHHTFIGHLVFAQVFLACGLNHGKEDGAHEFDFL